MIDFAPEVLVVVGGVIAVLCLFAPRRSQEKRSVGLVLCIALLVVVATDIVQNMPMEQALTALAVGSCLGAPIVKHFDRLKTVFLEPSHWIALTLVAYLCSVNWLHNQSMLGVEPLFRLLAFVPAVLLVLYICVARPQLADVRDGFTLGLGVSLMLSPLATTVWGECTEWKCGLAGALLRGPFGTENTLGWILSLVLLAHLLCFSKVQSTLIVAVAMPLLVMTSSRTSWLALACCVVAFVVCRQLEKVNARWLPVVFVYASVVSTFLVSLVLITTNDPEFASRRGLTWMMAREVVGDSWLFGRGIDAWSMLQGVGSLPHHYPHSQYVLVYFSGGVTGLALLGALYVALAKEALRNNSAELFGASMFFMVSSIFEITWNCMTVDYTVLGLVALFVLASRKRTTDLDRLTKRPSLGNSHPAPALSQR